MRDLFGKEIDIPERLLTKQDRKNIADRFKPILTRSKARASDLPGPVGKTCGDCIHAYGIRHGKKAYRKCAIARRKATKGSGTDIRFKDPACGRFEPETGAG